MPVIMCTRRLWSIIGGKGPLRQRREDPGNCRLYVWSAREVQTNTGPVFVALEETTYLTVVCPLVPLPLFVNVMAASVGAALDVIGAPRRAIDAEVMALLETTTFARNDNRSLLGSLNDVAFNAQVWLEDAPAGDLDSLERAQRQLNEMPHVNRTPAFPSQAVRLLFNSTEGVH